jgi:hypothetical protein
VGTCPTCEPCATIGYGLQRALQLGRSTVYVADGNYHETVTLLDGISLKGGYRAEDWSRHVETSATFIHGNTVSGHRKTIVGDGISQTTLIEGFVVFGQSNPEPRGNSYAVWLADAPGAVIRANRIYAGNGGPGIDGGTGADGEHGTWGESGLDSWNTGSTTCSAQDHRYGGGGGSSPCSTGSSEGGNGGDSECPIFGQQALGGASGSFPGGAGGAGGYKESVGHRAD